MPDTWEKIPKITQGAQAGYGVDPWGGGSYGSEPLWTTIARVEDSAQVDAGFGETPWGDNFGNESVWTKQPK